MAQKEEKLFSGGLDFDTEPHKVDPNDYRDAVSLRNGVGTTGKHNIVMHTRGNTIVSFSHYPNIKKVVIGEYEAKEIGAVIYMLWLGNRQHTILMYREEEQSIEILMESQHFGWNTEPITGIALVNKKLLGWTDNVMPRQINIERASTRNKLLSYNYFDVAPSGFSGTETVQIYDPQGNPVYPNPLNFTPGPLAISNDIIINPLPPSGSNPISTYVEQEQCSEHEVHITFKEGFEEYSLEVTRNTERVILLRDNHYPDGGDISEWHIALIRPQPWCAPVGEYKQDDDWDKDFVKGQTWQFRTRFVFADDQKSAWGPISKLVYNVPYLWALDAWPPGGVGPPGPYPKNPLTNPRWNQTPEANYIELDLSPLNSTGQFALTLDHILSHLREIEVAYRVGNDDPDWKRFAVLEREDFWKKSGTIPFATSAGAILCDFYNNSKTIQVSVDETDKLFDSVPEYARSLEFVGNRFFLGGLREGKDTPCTKAKIDVISNPEHYLEWLYPRIEPHYKWGGWYQFGLVYYDFAGRNCAVSTEARLEVRVPHLNETFGNYGNVPGDLSIPEKFALEGNKVPFLLEWTIENDSEIPEWATHYRWVRTRNLAYIKWLWFNVQGISTVLDWEHVSGKPGEYQISGNNVYRPSNGKQVRVNLDGITNGLYATPDHVIDPGGPQEEVVSQGCSTSQISYTYEEGDRIRFLWSDWRSSWENLNQGSNPAISGARRIIGDPGLEMKWDFPLCGYVFQEDWKSNLESRNDVIIDLGTSGDYDIYDKDFNLDVLNNNGSGGLPYYIPDVVEPTNTNSIFAGSAKAEIYNPGKVGAEEAEPFYEIGECMRIQNPGTPQRSHQVTTGIMGGGDAYLRHRPYLIAQDWPNATKPLIQSIGNPSGGAVGTQGGEEYIEAMDISDYYSSADNDAGRWQFEDSRAEEKERGDLIRFGGLYIPASKSNELNQFEEGNQSNVERRYNTIRKLIAARNVLLVVQENKTGSYTINENLITSLEGVDTVTITDRVMGKYRIFTRDLGTQHPESVKEYNGNIYGYDAQKHQHWRYANDGQTTISDYYAKSFFNDISAKINKYPDQVRVPAIYDPYYEELVMSFRKRFSGEGDVALGDIRMDKEKEAELREWLSVGDIIYIDQTQTISAPYGPVQGSFNGHARVVSIDVVTLQTGPAFLKIQLENPEDGSSVPVLEGSLHFYTGDTIVFCEPKNRYTTREWYLPEYYSRLDNTMISFLSGQLWRHDTNPVHNNFYGVQFPGQIKVVGNVDPGSVKMWMNIEEESTSAWHCPLITTPSGQQSRLLLSRFREEEGAFKAEFLRDLNTPNKTNPILNGDVLRSETVEILLQNDLTTAEELYAVKIYSINSQLTNR